ncbi:MAG: hypothetical protein K0M40_22775 [Prolixibacteraceae bacterium]|nr:hypothetical protein [Prolixibacteraceae bacterium]
MRNSGSISGTIPVKDGYFKVNLPLIRFEEDGCKIAYCPALDVSGYGNSAEEALESFKISLSEFFRYVTNKKTFEREMERMGWTISHNKHKEMTPPPMTKLLQDNDNFSRIFNEHSFNKENYTVDLPIAV